MSISEEDLSNLYNLDLNSWIRRFPLIGIHEKPSYYRGAVTSPVELAEMEQIRLKIPGAGLGPPVPADVFVFALGEPDRLDVTKIGGVPYRPSNAPWPRSDDGVPMTFVAQFRFRESRSLVGELPGDFLLVFLRDEFIQPGRSSVYLEWQSTGINCLMVPSSIPRPQWPLVTCYGIRWRTGDYTDFFQYASAANETVFQDDGDQVWAHAVFCRLHGVKIGGLPSWLFDDFSDSEIEPGSRLLCTLTSICPQLDMPYPWLNRQSPISVLTPLSELRKESFALNVQIALYIFLRQDGSVYWIHQFKN